MLYSHAALLDETIKVARAKFEAAFIEAVVLYHDGDLVAAATSLGITRESIYRKLRELDLTHLQKRKRTP